MYLLNDTQPIGTHLCNHTIYLCLFQNCGKNHKRFTVFKSLQASFWWGACSVTCWILVPRSGIEPISPEVAVRSPNYWMTREFLVNLIVKLGSVKYIQRTPYPLNNSSPFLPLSPGPGNHIFLSVSRIWLLSVQFGSVTQSCPTLCDPMDCSTPGFPVHHQLPEFTQTQFHHVIDAI